ncbi:3D (Asp-Asp-Asp) domain-containing protein [Marininema mesophilum]|uniref:3D (Asp-Asp-Asp) domain-containing protein n=1 Tax=Marininema mesophilum TaxID=1048340 RepID=A0A1H2WF46_9BACL|nr:3D domain-containing protein [Marininema mesophilum]SDW79106.1 3D (Asp-Asp-Asp) domain-containing protein [Marininema mesophilum]
MVVSRRMTGFLCAAGVLTWVIFHGWFPDGVGRVNAREGQKTVRVEKGDTVYKIAHENGTNVGTLTRINGLKNPSLIRVGQELRIPGKEEAVKKVKTASKTVPTMVRGKSLGEFTLTAYTAGPESTGKKPQDDSYGVTSSGTQVADGVTIAVDPDVIPIGSRVYIEGIGYRVAQDIGSAIQDKRIDIYMSDLEKARQFGVKKNVRVELVE